MRDAYPYLTGLPFLTPRGQLFSVPRRMQIADGLASTIVPMILSGGSSLTDIAKAYRQAWLQDEERTLKAVRKILAATGFASIVELDLDDSFDIVIVDPGWHGVYRNSVDLWQALNKSCRALLVAPAPPPSLYDTVLDDRLFVPSQVGAADGDPLVFLSLVRTILATIEYKLLLCTHRSVSAYLADFIAERPAVIHSDGHFEAWLSFGKAFEDRLSDAPWWQVLQELYLGYGQPNNALYFAALHRSFCAARENWFWMPSPMEWLLEDFPEARSSMRVVRPFIDEEFFGPQWSPGEDAPLLFTTTYGAAEIGAKGLDPLLRLIARVPHMRLRIIVADRTCVPAAVASFPNCEVICNIDRDTMRTMYYTSLANCRLSLQDSSPVSILESMACGTPVIVSPVIAANLPGMEHGKNAFVVAPEDIDGLESVVRLLAKDPNAARSIGLNGSRFAHKNSFIGNMRRVLESLADDSLHART